MGCAALLIEEFYKGILVLETQYEGLKLFWSCVSLLRKKIRDAVGVHVGVTAARAATVIRSQQHVVELAIFELSNLEMRIGKQ
ncbi:hypothetical protein Trco_005458 [Trichoderma cornu-damae]|uniref:Uncharacterized protein n=1 Tax=Trichoderma cornu-damae TaxID=654480 RepID=A0A9P8QHD3_9HYPO|nr:hypothetical protein Trco_005458 [Trichoderma cornu-damae]